MGFSEARVNLTGRFYPSDCTCWYTFSRPAFSDKFCNLLSLFIFIDLHERGMCLAITRHEWVTHSSQ